MSDEVFVVGAPAKHGYKTDIIPPGLAMQIDEVDSTTTYLGLAKTGVATSDARWQIRKITVSGTVTSFTWANGTADYNNVWDNRTGLTYS